MPSPTTDAREPSSDDRTFRAASYDDAVAEARRELGDDATIVAAHRVRRGGIGGFFATDLGVEVVARQPDASAATPTAADALLGGSGETVDPNWRDDPRYGALAKLLEHELARRDDGLPPRDDDRSSAGFEPLSVPVPPASPVPPVTVATGDPRRVDTYEPSRRPAPAWATQTSGRAASVSVGPSAALDGTGTSSAGARPAPSVTDAAESSVGPSAGVVASVVDDGPSIGAGGWAALEAMLDAARPDPGDDAGPVAAPSSTSSSFARRLLAEEIGAERDEALSATRVRPTREPEPAPAADGPSVDAHTGARAVTERPDESDPSGPAGPSSGIGAPDVGPGPTADDDPLRRPAELAVTAADEMVRRLGAAAQAGAGAGLGGMRELTVSVTTRGGETIEMTTRFGGGHG